MMDPVDPEKMRNLERLGRQIGQLIGEAINRSGAKDHGFALFIFSYKGSEMTYVSSANREDMIKALHEFLAKNPPPLTWDEQHG